MDKNELKYLLRSEQFWVVLVHRTSVARISLPPSSLLSNSSKYNLEVKVAGYSVTRTLRLADIRIDRIEYGSHSGSLYTSKGGAKEALLYRLRQSRARYQQDAKDITSQIIKANRIRG